MNDWFRSWHGAPTDPKWMAIAKRAEVSPGIVSAVVWALLDHASQAEPRGSVSGFDCEVYASFSGFEEDQVRAVYAALEAKSVIVEGRLAQWGKRQRRREDEGATDRQRASRNKQKPSGEDELPLKDPEPEPEQPASAPPIISPEARALADRVTEIVGHDAAFIPPAWCGADARAQMWLDRGWRVPLILESVRAQMAHKRDGPPDSIKYFEKGLTRAHADVGAPLPNLKIVERTSEAIHVAPRQQQNDSLAAVGRVRARLAASAAKGDP